MQRICPSVIVQSMVHLHAEQQDVYLREKSLWSLVFHLCHRFGSHWSEQGSTEEVAAHDTRGGQRVALIPTPFHKSKALGSHQGQEQGVASFPVLLILLQSLTVSLPKLFTSNNHHDSSQKTVFPKMFLEGNTTEAQNSSPYFVCETKKVLPYFVLF